MFTNGAIEVEAESYEAAQILIENMSDEQLLEECNGLSVDFTDEDGFSLD
jgi:hypothetical protein